MRRAAIIGCGLIGAKRAAALRPAFELVASYDSDATRSASFAARFGTTDAPSATDAISAAGQQGLVIVATTHDHLVPLALEAVEGGCHVLVEKPGARSVHEFRMLTEAAARHSRHVRVGFNHRFHPAVRRLRELMASRPTGRLLTVRGRYGHGGRVGYESEWRADEQRSGGGELLDQGVHLIDLCQHLFAPISLRYASVSTRYWQMDVEDNAFIHLHLADEADAWLHASWTEWKNLFSFEISFEQVKFELTGLGGSYGPEQLAEYWMGPTSRPPDITTWQWPPADDSWSLEMLDVADALDGRPHLGADARSTEAVLSIIGESYRR